MRFCPSLGDQQNAFGSQRHDDLRRAARRSSAALFGRRLRVFGQKRRFSFIGRQHGNKDSISSVTAWAGAGFKIVVFPASRASFSAASTVSSGDSSWQTTTSACRMASAALSTSRDAQAAVRARRDDDAVFACVFVHINQRHACRRIGITDDIARVDALGLIAQHRLIAEHVCSDTGDKCHQCAQTRRRDRLVRAFAARQHGKRRRPARFRRAWAGAGRARPCRYSRCRPRPRGGVFR